jgi:hypothetical protein
MKDKLDKNSYVVKASYVGIGLFMAYSSFRLTTIPFFNHYAIASLFAFVLLIPMKDYVRSIVRAPFFLALGGFFFFVKAPLVDHLGHKIVLYAISSAAIIYALFVFGALLLKCYQELKKKKPEAKTEDEMIFDSMLYAIAEQEKKNPLARPQIVGKEIFSRISAAMTNEKGIHVESLLTVLASLGGYSCQAAVRREFIETGKKKEKDVFLIIGAKNGKTFYYGDILNSLAFESELSVHSLVGGIVQHLGGKNFPDLHELAKYVTETAGGDKFGIPRLPEGVNAAADLPITYVKDLWPVVLPILDQYKLPPEHWPAAFGFALQTLIEQGKDVISPEIAFGIVMESVVPMSKIKLSDY